MNKRQAFNRMTANTGMPILQILILPSLQGAPQINYESGSPPTLKTRHLQQGTTRGYTDHLHPGPAVYYKSANRGTKRSPTLPQTQPTRPPY